MNEKGGLEDGKFPIHKLIPKDIVNQPKFLQKHPEFDGRGTVIAILDTGVDLACPGLQVTSTGAPKIIDAVNFTGSGDVITTEIRKPNERNEVIGLTGRTLKIPTSWKNSSNEYRLGLKRVYELYPEDLRSRVKHEKNKKFNEKTEKLIAQVLNRKNQHLEEFGNTTNSVEEQWRREDLRSQMGVLDESGINDDDGPVLDCIVWHDGEEWRACLDNTFQGDLFKCSPMTDYRKERQWGFLTPEDGLTYCLAIRNNGAILEITTPSGGHGTHCAHIAAAYYPESPKAGGVAPGAQIVSICVGDHRMGGYGSMLAFCRALHYSVEIGVDIINYSYGSVHRMISNSVAVGLLNRLVGQHGIPFFTSAGNEGPILTSMSDPGAQTPLVLCVGAILPEGTDMLLYGDSEERPTRVFEFSSRGPTSEGRLGLSFSAPGTACAGLPFYTQKLAEREDGTSMASPHAVGCAACIISGAKALNIPYSPYKLRLALENTAKIPASPSLTKLDYGHGIIGVDGAFEALQKMDNLSNSLADISVRVFYDSTGGSKHEERGVYIRDAYQLENASDYTVLLEPYFREDKADNATLHNFNIPVRLSSADSYVSYPKNIYLTNNETLFQLKVDHSNLEAGKVYFTEVVGHDASAEPSAGPIFRVPITVIKPLKMSENSLRKVLTLVAGQPERVFLRCPTDATKVAVTLRSLNKNSADLIFCQFAEKVASGKYAIPYKLEPNFEQTFYADVRDRSSFEFCAVLDLHNFDRETRIEVDFRFSGCYLHAFEMQSAAAVGEISLFNALTYDAIRPRMGFSEAATYIRPVSAKIEAANDRVKFMHGAEAYTLTLTYKVQVVEEGSVYFGFLGMDGDFQSHVESLQVMVFFDQCLVEPKQGDHYLQPGEYRLLAQVRHKDQLFLRKLKTATMECRRRIPYTDVKLCETYEGALKYGDQLEYLPLRPGQTRKLYYDGTFVYKLPKWLQPGDCVFGYIYIYEKDLNRNVTLKINGPIIDPTEETDNEMIALVAEEGVKKSDQKGLKERTRDLLIHYMTTTTDEKVAEETYKKLCNEYPDCPGLYSARLQMLFMKPERNVLEIRKAAMRMLTIVDVDEVFKFLGNGSQHDMNKVKNEEKMKEKVPLLSTTYGILVETLMDDYLSKSSKTLPAEFKNNFQFEPDLGFNEAPVQNEGIWGQKDGQLDDSKSSTNQIENGAKSASERRKGNFPNFGTIANVIVKLEEAKRRAKSFDGKTEGSETKSPATEMQEKSITLPAEDFTVLPAPPKQNVDEDLAEIDRLMVEYSKFESNRQDPGILSIKQSVCHENYGLALDALTGILRKQKCQRALKAAIQIADILGWKHLADQWRDSYIARYCIPKRNF